VFRHPTPYRDPLLDRVAALDGVQLEVLYLAEGFAPTPWEREPLGHAHAFPRGYLRRALGLHDVAIHPGALAHFARFRPDACVLSGWADPTVLAIAALCVVTRTPFVTCGETWHESGRGGAMGVARNVARRLMVRRARAWLPAGSRARDFLVGLGAAAERCHFFPTSPDARRWAAWVEALREEPALRKTLRLPDDGVVVFVGRVVEDKAPDVLLDAVALLRRTRPVTLALVGDGPMLEALRRHEAASATRFFGFLQPREVARVLAGSDVFALPSRFEPWGAVATEALAAGLPVVLSESVGCAPDLLPDGEVGEIVRTGDAVALAAALERQLARSDRRGALRARAGERALAWAHDLNLRSLALALRDAGVALSPQALRQAGVS
jgi:glycosyltransferase involved in cell wall biosynthesis